MYRMFWFSNFRQPIRQWNVSKLGPISERWINMFYMNPSYRPEMMQDPSIIISINSIINSFNIQNRDKPSPNIKRTNDDIRLAITMWTMYRDVAEKYYGHISSWDVSRVTNMTRLFEYRTKFNDDISSWNVSNVTNMGWMFNDAKAFNQPIGVWNVSNVTNMGWMFDGAEKFNQPIGRWNVSKVTNIRGMFNNAKSFNQPLVSWNLSKLEPMSNEDKERIFKSSGMMRDNQIRMFRNLAGASNKPASSGCVLCGGAKKTRRARRTIRKRPRKGRRTLKRIARRTRKR